MLTSYCIATSHLVYYLLSYYLFLILLTAKRQKETVDIDQWYCSHKKPHKVDLN